MQKIKKILSVCIASGCLWGCGSAGNSGSLTVQINDLTPPKIKIEKKPTKSQKAIHLILMTVMQSLTIRMPSLMYQLTKTALMHQNLANIQ